MFTAAASPVIVAVAETWCDLHSFFPSGRNLALTPIEAMLAGSVEHWVKAGSSSTGIGHFLLSLEMRCPVHRQGGLWPCAQRLQVEFIKLVAPAISQRGYAGDF